MATERDWKRSVVTWAMRLPAVCKCIRISSAQRTDVLAEIPVDPGGDKEALIDQICDDLEGIHSSLETRARYVLRSIRNDGDVITMVSVNLPKNAIEPEQKREHEMVELYRLAMKNNETLMQTIERQNKTLVDMLAQHAGAARSTLEHVVKVNEQLASNNLFLSAENQTLRKNVNEAQAMADTALTATDTLQATIEQNEKRDARIAKMAEPIVAKLADRISAKKLESANTQTKKIG